MITMQSNYSPELASERQEEENLLMIRMLLVIAGLSSPDIVLYNLHCEESASAYMTTLGEGEEQAHGIITHTDEQWEAAISASTPSKLVANDILTKAGITISNKLIKSCDDGMFSHIETAVYNDQSLNLVAQIERAVVDVEADHYVDNATGCCADEAVPPTNETEMEAFTRRRKERAERK